MGGAAGKAPGPLEQLLALCEAKGSRLSLVGLANHVDLVSRFSSEASSGRRPSSSCKSSAIVFRPYSSAQLEAVLQARLSVDGTCVLEADALRRVAAAVAKQSGDLRRGLGLCRSICEMWLRQGSGAGAGAAGNLGGGDRRAKRARALHAAGGEQEDPSSQSSSSLSSSPGTGGIDDSTRLSSRIDDSFVASALRQVSASEHATGVEELLQLPVQAMLLAVAACRCAGLLRRKDLETRVASASAGAGAGSGSSPGAPKASSGSRTGGTASSDSGSESDGIGSLLDSDSGSDSEDADEAKTPRPAGRSSGARAGTTAGAGPAEPGAIARPIRVRDLRRVHSRVCTRFLLSPVARSEFPDLLSRLGEAGVLRVQSGVERASSRRGGKETRGMASASSWLHGPSGATGGSWTDSRGLVVLLSRTAARQLAKRAPAVVRSGAGVTK